MDIDPSLVANPKSPVLVQPADGAFDHPARLAESTAMARPTMGEDGLDAPFPQRRFVLL